MSFTYDDLVDMLYAWTGEIAGDDLTDNLARIFTLAQARCQHSLELEIFVLNVPGSIGPSANIISRPVGCVEIQTVYRITGGQYIPLLQRSYEFVRDYSPNPTAPGTPKYWAEDDQNQIIIAPVSAGTLSYSLRHTALLAPLSESNPTNWLSVNVPDLLAFALLEEANLMLQEIPLANQFAGKYEALVPSVKSEIGSSTRVGPERLKRAVTKLPMPEVADGN